MPWHVRLTAPLAFALVASACSERPEGHFTEPQAQPLAQIAGGPACKLSELKSAAKTFFGLRTPGYNVAQLFTTQNVNKPAVLPIFFNLAHEIAVKARAALPTGLTPTQAAAGAEVHRQAVACAPVVDPDYADNMDNVEAALGPNGAYEVRGRSGTDNAVVLSHNTGQNGSSGIKAPPGVAPAGGFRVWAGGGAVIFYGFTQAASLGGEDPASDVPATFQWFTVRTAEFNENLRGLVGICVNTSAPFSAAQLRIQHEDGDDAVVLPVTTFDVCTTNSPTHVMRLSPIHRALAWLQERVSPAPLQAAMALATTSPSGSLRKFSPVEAVNPGGAVLTFVPAVIPNTAIDEGLGVKVVATGSNNTPWEGLNIKLVAFDNNGSWELIGDEAVTNDLGEADFTQSILNKPGVYKILAITQPADDSDAGGFAQDSVISGNSFHRTPN